MKWLFCLLVFCISELHASGQQTYVHEDSSHLSISPNQTIKTISKEYNPNIAIRRSAIIPGWGQATNKKYWKIPLVWGVLGTTSYLFVQNLHQYRDARDAYRLATDGDPSNDHLIKQPYFNVKDQPDRIRNFRNAVRQNMDYCVLLFILGWGLNIADAAVDANLKHFDVSDNLSLQLKAGSSKLAGTTGVSIVLSLGK